MSDSRKAKKTSVSINHDSPKYIQRTSLGQTKRGVGGETDSAHILSFGLVNTIMTNTSGRPRSEQSKRDLIRDMNDSSNMRIKSQYGNRVLDERRDAQIAQAFVLDKPIEGKATSTRAYQAYMSATSFSSTESIAAQLGNMRVRDSETGRTHLLKNHHKFM